MFKIIQSGFFQFQRILKIQHDSNGFQKITKESDAESEVPLSG